MKVTRREDFALLFMAELTRYYPSKYVSLSIVAKRSNLSPLFLKHIASDLMGSKLIESKEGIGGGYKLSKNPKELSVARIIEAISEDGIQPACFRNNTCKIKKGSCKCLSFWNRVNDHLFDYLNNMSLSEFAKL